MIPFRVQLLNKRVRVVLYRRKAGAPFYARWHFGGKPYHRSTESFTEARARQAAIKLVEAVAEPNLPDIGLTFAQAVERYLNDRWPVKEIANRTLHDHTSRLRKFAKSYGQHDVGATSFEQAVGYIQRFIRERKGLGDSPVSQSNYQRILSRFCNWLLKTRDEQGRPLAAWRINPASKQFIEIDEAETILKPPVPEDLIPVLLEKAKTHRVWPAVLLCLGAGLRSIEAARQRWDKIDMKARKLIAKGKGREREIRISDWLHSELEKLPHEGERVYAASLFEVGHDMRRFREAAGLPAIVTLQACRRTACRKAAPHMTVEQYSHYFGHSITVAKRHYIGYGLMGSDANVNKLDYSDKKPDKDGVGNSDSTDISIYEK